MSSQHTVTTQPPPPYLSGSTNPPAPNTGFANPAYSTEYSTPPERAGQGVQWMSKPQAAANCPPGLEYLAQIDQLLVHQQVELFEIFTSWECKNRYQIKNSMDQQVYFASEESDTCHRQCCGPMRQFTMHIQDNQGTEVLRVFRPFKCCSGCCWCAGADCCAQEATVEGPAGNVLGYVVQEQSCCRPRMGLLDKYHKPVLEVSGPPCLCQGCGCCCEVEFPVTTTNGDQIGQIGKQWAGCFREFCTDADNFVVTFPMDLDVQIKAVMLGAVFLIDFMFFETKQNNNN